jgi:hypothetical protein
VIPKEAVVIGIALLVVGESYLGRWVRRKRVVLARRWRFGGKWGRCMDDLGRGEKDR